MIRQTKIIATLGPSTTDEGVIRSMIDAGVDLFRYNLSHSSIEAHCEHARIVRQIAADNKVVGHLFDLPGPKLRIEGFKTGKADLVHGQLFILDTQWDPKAGDEKRVGISYQELPGQVASGKRLLIDDGKIVLEVEQATGSEIICRVITEGVISDRKGFNLEGGGLAAPALTETDMAYIDIAVRDASPDYFAVSFVSCAADVEAARTRVESAGGHAGIIAKIERREALDNLIEIITAADAVMVARGDLGIEVGDASLPAIQKYIFHQARLLKKPVIIATQMMESMIASTVPTRAEVFDVANAVTSGSDAVMLSAETASGKHPVRVIAKMSEICLQAEMQPDAKIPERINAVYDRIDETIAMSAMYAATHFNARAILALTESGRTALWMSRVTGVTDLPIYALTPKQRTCGKVALYRGVHPVEFICDCEHYDEVIRQAIARLVGEGRVNNTDTVIITKGTLHQQGRTNSIDILKVNDILSG